MKKEETLPKNGGRKTISTEKLIELLKDPTDEVKEGNKIVLVDYHIKDKNIFLNEEITINPGISFRNCFFESQYPVYFGNFNFNSEIVFKECFLPNGVQFEGGVFKKKIEFNQCTLGDINLFGGVFTKIEIKWCEIKQIWINGVNFKEFYIGGSSGSGWPIESITINYDPDTTGDITIIDQEFEEIHVSGINNKRKISFKNVKSDSITFSNFTNNGELRFYDVGPKDPKCDKKYFKIIQSNLGFAQFYRVLFASYKYLIIKDSLILKGTYINCEWSNNIRAFSIPEKDTDEDSTPKMKEADHDEINAIKEAYRQLKIAVANQDDKILEKKFYAKEMTFYNKSLKCKRFWRNEFWDKMILCMSKCFSDYGQSFIKPLVWLLGVHFILFLLALVLHGFDSLHISFLNPKLDGFEKAFVKYFIYINPFRSLETTLPGYLIIIDLAMRMWSSYMIYNLVRASRRFIS